MKSREQWNKKLPLVRKLTKAQTTLAIQLINLNRELRNLEKFGPLAESLEAPGEKWHTNQRQIWEVRKKMHQTAENLFFY